RRRCPRTAAPAAKGRLLGSLSPQELVSRSSQLPTLTLTLTLSLSKCDGTKASRPSMTAPEPAARVPPAPTGFRRAAVIWTRDTLARGRQAPTPPRRRNKLRGYVARPSARNTKLPNNFPARPDGIEGPPPSASRGATTRR